jgi:amino acid adenylation domain-containing protein
LVEDPVAEETYVFPLSFAQQRLWFLDRMVPGNPFYNIPLVVPVRWPVQVSALERSLNALAERHESLRTVFRATDGEPVQMIRPRLDLKVRVTDLRPFSSDEREARTLDLAAHEAQLPFDLEHGPLIRCGLLVRGAADYVLLLTMHHIVSDGWSMGILANELTAFYQAALSGFAPRLPQLPVQYADFTIWQREQLQGGRLDKLVAYWREQLSELPVVDLPSDRPRPPALTYRGAFHRVMVPASIAESVRRFAMEHHATPFMALLAAFAALLHRYCGCDDVAIGTPVANRNRAEVEGLIGFFVNSLVLRISAAGDLSFAELVEHTKQVCIGAYAHQDLPFEKVVEEVRPPRNPARNPLFQITFQLIDLPTLQKTPVAAAASAAQMRHGTAIFDLAVTLMESAGGYEGVFEYSTDLFDVRTMERLDVHFQRLAAAGIANPHAPLSTLPLLDANERAEELRRSRGARADVRPPLVHHRIADQTSLTPDAVAVQSGEERLTYGELLARARRLAHHLRAAGVSRGTATGILLERSVALPVAILAVLESGGAYVPLDPSYPAERLRFMLDDSAAPVVVTDAAHAAHASELANGRAVTVICLDDIALASSQPDGPCDVALAAEDLAYILYTSGSTGRPKGVAVPHGALANHMQWMLERFPFTAADRVLQRTPYAFDASVWELFAPLMSGARLVMLPPDAHRDPEMTVAELARNEITIVQVVPALLRMLLEEPELYACSSLRRIFCGGEALSDALRDQAVSALGADLVNLYGPTEATIDATDYVCGKDAEPFGVPIGLPIFNTCAYVLDQHFALVPRGVEGELCLGGSSLARGYFSRPSLTAERFVPDPFSEVGGERMYRTGDRVRRLADGNLLFTGRRDEQLKVRGFRIEPGEIESVVCRLPGVKSCVVTVDSATLTAFVVCAGSDAPEMSRVRASVAAQLPEHMVPSAFVAIDAMPLLPNGKIDRAAVAALGVARGAAEGGYAPPRTPLEEALCVIWTEVLDVPRVGIHDDFFTSLGGHSLIATRLISRIRSALGTDVPLKQIFEAPTVETFAAALLDRAAEDERRAVGEAAGLVVRVSRMSEAELDDRLRVRRVQ